MTVTSNIFVGISAWAPNTTYNTLGTRRSNGGNAYQLITTGTSAATGGPSGTSSDITDGTAHWKFLSAIDFTTLSSWASSIPTTLTQPIVGQLWNVGTITTTAGTAFVTLGGHTTSPSNTITLTAAPGESIRDTLAGQTTALAFNTSNGVSFTLPSGVGGINYIGVNDANVIIDGLQFQDPFSTSNCSIIGGTPTNLLVRNCILDGFAQTGGANIIDPFGNCVIENCLIIDRSNGNVGFAINQGNSGAGASVYVNNTIISINGSTNGGAVASSATTAVKNCAIFGFANLTGTSNSLVGSMDHCVFSNSGVPAGVTDGGSNLGSKTAANQFVNTATDFRLKAGADCIDHGAADTTDIPSGDDIAKSARTLGSNWDVGAWEFVSAINASSTQTIGPFRSAATTVNPINPTQAETAFSAVGALTAVAVDTSSIQLTWGSPTPTVSPFGARSAATAIVNLSATTRNSINFTAAVTVIQRDLASSTNYVEVLNASAQMGQTDGFTSTNTITFNAASTVIFTTPASGSGSLLTMSSVANAKFTTPASAANTIEVLTATGNMAQWTVSGTNSFFPVSSVAHASSLALAFSTNTITYTASGNIVPTNVSTFFVIQSVANFSINIPIQTSNARIVFSASAQVSPFNQASATNSFLNLVSNSQAILEDIASATNTFATMLSSAIAGQNSNVALNSINFRANATAALFDLASAVNRFFVLSNITHSPKLLQEENFKNILTDPGQLFILTDEGPPSALQSTTGSGSASLTYVVNATSVNSNGVTSTSNINYTVAATATGSDTAQARNNINFTGTGMVPNVASARNTFFVIQATQASGKFITSDPAQLFIMTDPPLVAPLGVTNVQSAPTTTSLTLSWTASQPGAAFPSLKIQEEASFAFQEDMVTGTGTIVLTAVVAAKLGTTATCQQSIQFSAAATCTSTMFASARNSFFAVSCTAVSFGEGELEAFGRIDYAAHAVAGQSNAVTSTNSINYVCHATFGVGFACTATNNIDFVGSGNVIETPSVSTIVFSAQGQLLQSNVATAANKIDFVGHATCSQKNSFTATNNIDITAVVSADQGDVCHSANTIRFSAVCTAEVNGSQMSSTNTITFRAAGVIFNEVGATCLADFFILKADPHADLWVSPDHFVEGEQMVYWPD